MTCRRWTQLLHSFVARKAGRGIQAYISLPSTPSTWKYIKIRLACETTPTPMLGTVVLEQQLSYQVHANSPQCNMFLQWNVSLTVTGHNNSFLTILIANSEMFFEVAIDDLAVKLVPIAMHQFVLVLPLMVTRNYGQTNGWTLQPLKGPAKTSLFTSAYCMSFTVISSSLWIYFTLLLFPFIVCQHFQYCSI